MTQLQSENKWKIIDALSPEVKALLGLDGKASPSPGESEVAKCTRRTEYLYLGDERRLCGCRAVLFICKKQLHRSGRRAYCGREWCPRCGVDESDMHKRRYARLMDKVFYLGDAGKNHGLGYFVFTMPSQIREIFKRKSRLASAGRFLRSLLKNHGFEVGISRWHYFGDGKIVEGELDLGVYHPHLNCLVVGCHLHPKKLASIKEAWRRYLEVVSGETIDVVDIHYQYFQAKFQWWHKAVYVTRSTFKSLAGNESLAEKIFGFRNLVFWGFGQGDKREEKIKRGRVVLRLWLEDMQAQKSQEVMSQKAWDNLVEMSRLHCIKCQEEGRGLVPIEAYLDANGYRKMEDMEFLKPYIERELKGGYFLLSEVMFTKKPMSQEVEEGEFVYEDYDTS